MISFEEYSSYDGIGLAQLVKNKEVKPEELLEAAFKGIEKLNPELNAVVKNLPSEAEKEISSGLSQGYFQGVPFLIKELILHAANIPISMGSYIAEGFVAPYDTELMSRFRKAGLVTVGTTPTPEMGYNATTEALIYGPTKNPWNTERSPGGSSGGSAAAVAAGIVPLAHANDGGGSIRIPAACNGLVGIKPTRGRTPTGPDQGEPLHGLGIEFAVTRSVRDSAALLDTVQGPDPGCYAYAERPSRPYYKEINTEPGSLKIAWMDKPLSSAPVDSECVDAVHNTINLLEDLGHKLAEDSPEIDIEAYNDATVKLWASFLAHTIDVVGRAMNRIPSEKNIEAAIWSCYKYGKELTAIELLEAYDIYNMISRKVGSFFENYDVLMSPTLARTPIPLGELNSNAPGLTAKEWTEQVFEVAPFTNIFNATGQPAISLPLQWSTDNLPIGIQFAGRFADETTLFRLAAQLEKAKPWERKIPGVHVTN